VTGGDRMDTAGWTIAIIAVVIVFVIAWRARRR
jgi:hypothetical protein